MLLAVGDGGIYQGSIFRLLGSGENEGGVGRSILGLVFANG